MIIPIINLIGIFLLKILDKHDRHSIMNIRCFNFLMNINYNQNINDKKQKQRGDN